MKRNKKYITLMESLQKHSNSDYCCCNKTCHFSFPKPPAVETLIWAPTSDDKKNIIQTARNILQKVQQFLSSIDMDIQDMTIDSIRQSIGVDLNAYNNALQVSKWGTNIILKCNVQDVFINPCNRDILILWAGNMDLQPVIDDVSAVMYACSYVTKGEKAMGETLKNVAN